MKIIAKIQSDFDSKFGIPRQSGLVDELKAKIIFEPQFRVKDAVRGLEDFSHIWLLWNFSKSPVGEWTPTVRPPVLGGNERMGVFATRSPVRPNPIGLSVVRLEKIELDSKLGPILHVSGADLLNGTPIFDIKPYIPYADSYPEATGGFTQRRVRYKLQVEFPPHLLEIIPEDKRVAIVKVLELDPRPSYHEDPHRQYGFEFAGYDVRFVVMGDLLTVQEVLKL